MEKQIWENGGLWSSQNVLTALVSKGLNRVEAYECVQSIAMAVTSETTHLLLSHSNGESRISFQDALAQNQTITKYLNAEELKNIFSLEKYLKYVPLIFNRVFGVEPKNFLSVKKIPALQTVIKVTVELFPDVLDAESKTIQNDMLKTRVETTNVRTQKSFLIKIEDDSMYENVETYAKKVLYNPVMEKIKIERVK